MIVTDLEQIVQVTFMAFLPLQAIPIRLGSLAVHQMRLCTSSTHCRASLLRRKRQFIILYNAMLTFAAVGLRLVKIPGRRV